MRSVAVPMTDRHRVVKRFLTLIAPWYDADQEDARLARADRMTQSALEAKNRADRTLDAYRREGVTLRRGH